MSISVVEINPNLVVDNRGPYLRSATLVVTGLTASGANTIPHGLPAAPRRVWCTPVGDAVLGALASLDTSQGNTDPTGTLAGGKLGYDATNVYVYVGSTTQLLLHAEY